jgi:monothiol glutaredoxin
LTKGVTDELAGNLFFGRKRAWVALGQLLGMPASRQFALDAQSFGIHIWESRGPDGPARVGASPAQKEDDMSIEQFIANEVKSNDVVLFMKGTPQFPQCGFSGQVVQILDHIGVGYKGLNVLESAELRNGIKTYSNWPTIPQLYVKGEFVGGCDIIREMFQAGELQQLFADKGVPATTAA